MKIFTHDGSPCWYELGWSGGNNPAIILSIRREFVGADAHILSAAPVVADYKKEFGFANFESSFDKDFGSDNAFVRIGEENGFIKFSVPLPKVKKETGEKCPRCKGIGKDKVIGAECFRCFGSGREHKYDWALANKVSASCGVFFSFAGLEREISSSLPQLLIVEAYVTLDRGAPLGGEYSPDLVRWLRTLEPRTQIQEMVQAMKIAYDYMIGASDFDRRDIEAYVADTKGRLNVSCPGNACGLNPVYGAESDMKRGFGYRFSCHNVDNPAQQLTLLAGLAALHDKARKEMKV
ncbi:MAG: hypothetical protein HY764_01060 [Candidatus Portnoybacteria bacterium]|nr:hypothetical protein [Candidatus Portnoybacteria bacterium]